MSQLENKYKRNVGVLEVKMKNRLQTDAEAIAIGSLREVHINKKARHRSTVKLAPIRPTSFERERQHAMDVVELPAPTQALIHKHVDHIKHEHENELAHLPPIAGAFKKRGVVGSSSALGATLFAQAYQRGELPIMIECKAGGKTVRWTQDIRSLDYSKYFPLFLEGIRSPGYPYNFLAREGAFQLLDLGHEFPERVLDCLARVIPAIRSILESRDPKYIRDALLVLQALSRIQGVGQALVPYYRHVLPVLNIFKNKRRNLGDAMDFQQHKHKDLAEMIVETLELLEATGGPDACVNIKYMIPTYESTVDKRQ